LGMTLSAHAEVTTESLPEMQIGTIGEETGLSADIWGKQPDADKVLSQIRAAATADFNDAEKEILRRILMTDVGGVVPLEQEAYLIERMKTLAAQGMADEALKLGNLGPEKNKSDALKRTMAEILFVIGRANEACAENLTAAFGKKEAFIRAACVDAVGVPPETALAYEVYRESEQDQFPFMNAAGEVLYRGLETPLPTGTPDVWEMPILARAYGTEIFKLDLSKQALRTLVNQESVPTDVRLIAVDQMRKATAVKSDGDVLTHLIQVATERRLVEATLGARDAK